MDPNKAHYVACTAIIVKDGKFLIAKRSEHEKVCPGEWTVPGGKLEVDDYQQREKFTSYHWYDVAEHVVRREVKEEVGLAIKNIKYLTSITYIRPDGIPSVILSYFAEHHDGDVQLSKDLTEFAWVTLAEAKNYKLIEGIYEELEMLSHHLSGGALGNWKP